MTQILAALTQEYVLVASDRRLTFVGGRNHGEVADDDTCKLVSLCGIWGIATQDSLESRIEQRPTHEWIGIRLAENRCRSPYLAAELLRNGAASALRAARLSLELTFLIAGWARDADGGMQPHFLLISNMYQRNGDRRNQPGIDLNGFERKLGADELYAARVIGQSLPNSRGKQRSRQFRKMLKKQLGPRLAMYAFASEIANTAKVNTAVGANVLAFCIPRQAAAQTYRTGGQLLLAREPDLLNVSFCFFNPARDELRQYGPTHVCGDSAVTDLETVNDPSRDFQSSSVRILYQPKKYQG